MQNVKNWQKVKTKVRMMFRDVKMPQDRYPDAITSSTAKNSRINVFRRKQATSKVTAKIFRAFVVKQKVRLIFCRARAA